MTTPNRPSSSNPSKSAGGSGGKAGSPPSHPNSDPQAPQPSQPAAQPTGGPQQPQKANPAASPSTKAASPKRTGGSSPAQPGQRQQSPAGGGSRRQDRKDAVAAKKAASAPKNRREEQGQELRRAKDASKDLGRVGKRHEDLRNEGRSHTDAALHQGLEGVGAAAVGSVTGGSKVGARAGAAIGSMAADQHSKRIQTAKKIASPSAVFRRFKRSMVAVVAIFVTLMLLMTAVLFGGNDTIDQLAGHSIADAAMYGSDMIDDEVFHSYFLASRLAGDRHGAPPWGLLAAIGTLATENGKVSPYTDDNCDRAPHRDLLRARQGLSEEECGDEPPSLFPTVVPHITKPGSDDGDGDGNNPMGPMLVLPSAVAAGTFDPHQIEPAGTKERPESVTSYLAYRLAEIREQLIEEEGFSPPEDADTARVLWTEAVSRLPIADSRAMAACGVGTSPTPVMAGPTSGQPLLIGDSVLHGSFSHLGSALSAAPFDYPDPDNAVGRPPQRGLELLQEHYDSAVPVVWALGYNFGGSREQFRSMLDQVTTTAESSPRIVLVTLYNGQGRPAWDGVNAEIREAEQRHGNVVVADWASIANANSAYIAGDDLHLTPEGGVAFAHMIADALSGSGSASNTRAAPSSSGPVPREIETALAAGTATPEQVAEATAAVWWCALRASTTYTLDNPRTDSSGAYTGLVDPVRAHSMIVGEAVQVAWLFSEYGAKADTLACTRPEEPNVSNVDEDTAAELQSQYEAASSRYSPPGDDEPYGVFPITQDVFDEHNDRPAATRCDPLANIEAAAAAFVELESVEPGTSPRDDTSGPWAPVAGGWAAMPWVFGTSFSDFAINGPLSTRTASSACVGAMSAWVYAIAPALVAAPDKTLALESLSPPRASCDSLTDTQYWALLHQQALNMSTTPTADDPHTHDPDPIDVSPPTTPTPTIPESLPLPRPEGSPSASELPTPAPTTTTTTAVPQAEPAAAVGALPATDVQFWQTPDTTSEPDGEAPATQDPHDPIIAAYLEIAAWAHMRSEDPEALSDEWVLGEHAAVARFATTLALPPQPDFRPPLPQSSFAQDVVQLASAFSGIITADHEDPGFDPEKNPFDLAKELLASTGGAGVAISGDAEAALVAAGVPPLAARAYVNAAQRAFAENPECAIPLDYLAAFGKIESQHGAAGGGVIQESGDVLPKVLGPPLNGGPFGDHTLAVIRDTDNGEWDSDTVWDRAVGPMQFIPTTWRAMARDGNDDGLTDPHNFFDATYGAAIYLCHGASRVEGGITSEAGQRAGAFGYNQHTPYVDAIMQQKAEYAPFVAAISMAPTAGSGSFIWPADGPITSPWGNRVHPIYGTVRFHAGLDLGTPMGAPIWAAADGVVIHAGWNGGYGNQVIIDHGEMRTSYAHLSRIIAPVGTNIRQGQVLGEAGSTGSSTAPHLHFETLFTPPGAAPMTGGSSANTKDPLSLLPPR